MQVRKIHAETDHLLCVVQQAEYFMPGQLIAALQKIKLNCERDPCNFSAKLLHQLYRCAHRPVCRYAPRFRKDERRSNDLGEKSIARERRRRLRGRNVSKSFAPSCP